ncbi:hypothetical protein J2W37_002406 [Variovorax paradoxus]|uniref:Uncharacterized protein n=1 Tax=Variovorax paradoxus TaxID=34073 RepID=A0AAE3XZG4_VARPD|nr:MULTISPECIES: hypothetical protein [Variovorax]MBD9665554.1 hypothetical protein [Variovorax sp. VRV01]MDP9964686.1 hypothetical protein [Variovorax paradoxus]MDR6427585.1 hypothetical protein [Variovorax paradoxus]MDR6454747.1 hypothetical protein [Variovorax paradoxus]
MLTIDQKEAILRWAGVSTPAFPSPGVLWRQQRQHDAAPSSRTNPHAVLDPGTAAKQWAHAINTLFVAYSAARAARSLRKAEEARQLSVLRQLQCHAGADTETGNAAASGARKVRRPRRRSHAMG